MRKMEIREDIRHFDSALALEPSMNMAHWNRASRISRSVNYMDGLAANTNIALRWTNDGWRWMQLAACAPMWMGDRLTKEVRSASTSTPSGIG